MSQVIQLTVRPGMASLGVIYTGERPNKGGTRSCIEKFSESSQKRLSGWLALAVPHYNVMVTLTVPHVETDGLFFKDRCDRWLSRALSLGKESLGEEASLTWFLEFQSRGAPHLHILANFYLPKDWVASSWTGLWSSALIDRNTPELVDKMLSASTRVEYLRSARAARRYALKYATKTNQKDVPDGYSHVGRFWGIRGSRERVAADRYRVNCGKGFGFPGDKARLLWADTLQQLAQIPGVKIYNWGEGTGFSVYYDENIQGEVAALWKRLIETYELEQVLI